MIWEYAANQRPQPSDAGVVGKGSLTSARADDAMLMAPSSDLAFGCLEDLDMGTKEGYP